MSFIGRKWADVFHDREARVAWIIQSYMSFFSDNKVAGGGSKVLRRIDFIRETITEMSDMFAALEVSYTPSTYERKLFRQLPLPRKGTCCMAVLMFLSIVHSCLGGVDLEVFEPDVIDAIRNRELVQFFSRTPYYWNEKVAVADRPIETEIELYLDVPAVSRARSPKRAKSPGRVRSPKQ